MRGRYFSQLQASLMYDPSNDISISWNHFGSCKEKEVADLVNFYSSFSPISNPYGGL